MLLIHHPRSYGNERGYILDVIFNEFLGLPYRAIAEDRRDVCISAADAGLFIADVFFQTPRRGWLTESSLPGRPLAVWRPDTREIADKLAAPQIPVIFGQAADENRYSEISSPQKITLNIDIFGSAFFMLTRYEEAVKADRDSYGRFPAKAGLALQEGFLERPIVNEYVEILWWGIHKLWPGLSRKPRQFRAIPTHDVDSPFDMLFSPGRQIARNLAGDILKRRSLPDFFNRLGKIYNIKIKKDVSRNEYYTFDLIMDISERHNLSSVFYMMTARGLSAMDGNYPLDSPQIVALMNKVHARGHELGLHPSFVSYLDARQIKREFEYLRSVCAGAGIDLSGMGGRQHFLRWQAPHTWQHYEDAGLSYDTTLSYADHIGFRCGVCYEYPAFNLNTGAPLKLKERPLIVMECTALDKRYMNLSVEESLQRIAGLKYLCKKYGGDFVILWHNTRFIAETELELYKNILEC